jgi:hypothetical protein
MAANTATSAGLAARRDPEGCSRHAKNISCRCYCQNQSGDYHPSGDSADKGSDVTGGGLLYKRQPVSLFEGEVRTAKSGRLQASKRQHRTRWTELSIPLI